MTRKDLGATENPSLAVREREAELALLTADQARDMRVGHRARNVVNPLGLQHLVSADEDGIARFAQIRPLRASYEVHHGTLYGYKRQLCRCAKCRASNATWQRDYRRRAA